jgi:hypothetical protein
MRWKRKSHSSGKLMVAMLIAVGLVSIPKSINAADTTQFIVYSVHTALNMGNPGEVEMRDYFVNMGSNHGVSKGSTLIVHRKSPSYDLQGKKLFQDVTFPIARLKVIHSEGKASIARLEKMMPESSTPNISPRAVIVGDLVHKIK